MRQRIEAARPWTPERPLLVVTSGPLNALPYDLWQQGQHVTLALYTFFPKLAYPMVRELSPTRRVRRRILGALSRLRRGYSLIM
ncbi:MAG: hypothetical protein ACP5J4_14010 [Anaerolineae bacterium]